ncbi:MAG: TetR family transcriptional regulator C-terminal domain-containing protein [Sporocytophaga sp.]|nr:TetR family transcriptional regulator C-terminal domain-containing protein [Sporocytophaga sp.]
MDKQQILETYKVYLLENGKIPTSVYSFCKLLNITESEFYGFYNSLEAIERDFWLQVFESSLTQLEQDPIYQNYSAREKLLAFYFVWIQKMRENRSYVLLKKDNLKLYEIAKNNVLDDFKNAFYKYVDTLIKQGVESREVKERKYISDKYKHGFWLQALFVLNYWVEDTSNNFEMTDAAIEKAVDLSFRLIGEHTMDSLIDFGKFLLTKK